MKEVFDTIQDPANGSPLNSLVATQVASYDAPDDTTLVINLNHPYFGILNAVKTGFWRIVNIETRDALGPDVYGQTEIDGSGPFTLDRVHPRRQGDREPPKRRLRGFDHARTIRTRARPTSTVSAG